MADVVQHDVNAVAVQRANEHEGVDDVIDVDDVLSVFLVHGVLLHGVLLHGAAMGHDALLSFRGDHGFRLADDVLQYELVLQPSALLFPCAHAPPVYVPHDVLVLA